VKSTTGAVLRKQVVRARGACTHHQQGATVTIPRDQAKVGFPLKQRTQLMQHNALNARKARNKRSCQNGLTENAGHEIGVQNTYRLKIDYIVIQCAILFRTMAEHKSQQQGKLYNAQCYVHYVPKKNIPDIFHCNVKKDYQILIIFGMNIPETTCCQVTI